MSRLKEMNTEQKTIRKYLLTRSMKRSPRHRGLLRVMLNKERFKAFADQVVEGGDHPVQRQLLPLSPPPWLPFSLSKISPASERLPWWTLIFKAKALWLPWLLIFCNLNYCIPAATNLHSFVWVKLLFTLLSQFFWLPWIPHLHLIVGDIHLSWILGRDLCCRLTWIWSHCCLFVTFLQAKELPRVVIVLVFNVGDSRK